MDTNPDHTTSLISITGKNNMELYVLGNLYEEPFDAESVLSVVIELSHKPNVKWDCIYSTESWCTSMHQTHSGKLFVSSMEGKLHIFSQNSWSLLDLSCPDGVNSVWALNDDEVFAAGLKGELIRITGLNIQTFIDPLRRRINAISGSSEKNVFAVGDKGLVYQFDGKNWNELECPTNVNLLAVLCCSDDLVYIAGAKGTIFQWSAIGFDLIEGPQSSVTDLAYFMNKLYATAGREGVQMLKGDQMFPVKDLLVYRMRAIGDRLFCIGNRLVAQFDGIEWWGGELDI